MNHELRPRPRRRRVVTSVTVGLTVASAIAVAGVAVAQDDGVQPLVPDGSPVVVEPVAPQPAGPDGSPVVVEPPPEQPPNDNPDMGFNATDDGGPAIDVEVDEGVQGLLPQEDLGDPNHNGSDEPPAQG